MKKVLFAALLLAAVGCKKNKEDEQAITRDRLVGTYRQTGELENGVDTWNTANYDACEMDDTYAFNADGTFVQTDAGASCNNGMGSFTSTWTLNGNTLAVAGQNATVESLSNNKLVVKDVMTSNGVTTTTVVTFTRL